MAFSLLGYLFGAMQFYTIPWLTAIALPAAAMILAVGIGLICSVPEHDPLLLLRERSGAGVLARSAIPAILLMIPLVLWLRVEGHENGYYDLGTGRALGALALVVGVVGVLWIALTALRRHEDALREVNQRKDEFLATLAHELRNPLAPLTNGLMILDLSRGDEKIASETRATMSRQLKQLVRLVDDLLDVSRISRNVVEIRKERVELHEVVEEALESIRPLCEAAAQDLRVRLPERPVWLEADRVRLAQIVYNLLSNACRYSTSGSEIGVHAYSEGADAVICVKDQGIGLSTRLKRSLSCCAPTITRCGRFTTVCRQLRYLSDSSRMLSCSISACRTWTATTYVEEFGSGRGAGT
jgi:signal transduction histidine kinase